MSKRISQLYQNVRARKPHAVELLRDALIEYGIEPGVTVCDQYGNKGTVEKITSWGMVNVGLFGHTATIPADQAVTLLEVIQPLKFVFQWQGSPARSFNLHLIDYTSQAFTEYWAGAMAQLGGAPWGTPILSGLRENTGAGGGIVEATEGIFRYRWKVTPEKMRRRLFRYGEFKYPKIRLEEALGVEGGVRWR